MEWRWYSGICHRDAPTRYDQPHYDSVPLHQAFDGCLAYFDRGVVQENRRVGVLGFLLSCKRGYHEALYTLYATNSIIVEYQPFILALLRQDRVPDAPRLIGHGLQLITSLCLRTTFSLWSVFQDEDRAHFEEYTRLLPLAFPRLQRLEWSLGQNAFIQLNTAPQQLLGEFEDVLLRPLLKMRDGMAAMKECIVAVQMSLFFAFAELRRQKIATGREYVAKEKHLARLWYPFVAVSEQERVVEKGFWIAFGSDIWDYDGALASVVQENVHV
ncbi:hypothetical protein VTI74DRAFT_8207 [Chaetomium olivicolor]